jgi:predicted negative regulator of RcsB-dependent stress response
MDFTYKILIAGAIIVVAGWIAYGIWRYKTYLQGKNEPERKTEHLDKVKKSFEEYTKKMEQYKLRPYERKDLDGNKKG